MKQWRGVAGFMVVLLLPLLVSSGNAVAETLSTTQELHVRAVVPGHRDVVVDTKGQIMEITSNTLEDTTPTVYFMKIDEKTQRPLTSELMTAYRKLVPEGTAKYGVLYKRTFLATLLYTPRS